MVPKTNNLIQRYAMIKNISLDKYINKYKHNANCILLVGSRAEGFATRNSDIDLILITETPEKYGVVSNSYIIRAEEGVKIEILIITSYDIEKTIIESFDKQDFYTLQKILFGKIMFGEFNCNRNYLQEVFKEKYYIKKTDQALKIYSTLEGIKKDSHIQQYVFLLKKYLENIAEIYLIVLGDNYIKPRWLISRLIRMEGHDSTMLKDFFTAINISVNGIKDLELLERHIMNITSLMLYKAIYVKESTIDNVNLDLIVNFFAMEREGKIVLFFEQEAFIIDKENAKLVIEHKLFKVVNNNLDVYALTSDKQKVEKK